MDNAILNEIKYRFRESMDIRYRDIQLPQGKVTITYFEVISVRESIAEYIVQPIMKNGKDAATLKDLAEKVLYVASAELFFDLETIVTRLLLGTAIITCDFDNIAIGCDVAFFRSRGIPKPDTDPVIKGPQEGFNEFIKDNLSMIRKRLQNEDLALELFEVGSISKTPVILMYIKSIAPSTLVNKVRTKIQNLKIDFILETNYIEEEFQTRYTLFETVGNYEKPDIICAKLCEGRVALMVEGSPSLSVFPTFFAENFHSPDDYYINRFVVTGLRILRYASFGVATMLPGFYLALTTYHHSLMPSVFLFKLASARAGVPFPEVVELFLMILFLELSREAGRRLPRSIGSTLSLVSTLILGETALKAGMASGGTIVIVGVYAITSLINPKLIGPVISLTLANTVCSAIFGLHGFFIFFIIMVGHIASLESCGYPYLFPLGTSKRLNYKGQDLIFRGKLKNISGKILKGTNKE